MRQAQVAAAKQALADAHEERERIKVTLERSRKVRERAIPVLRARRRLGRWESLLRFYLRLWQK